MYYQFSNKHSAFQFKTSKPFYCRLVSSNEADIIQEILQKKRKKHKMLSVSFNITFCYIVHVFSHNHSNFGDYVERIYTIELDIKDT